jgi:hypothetical protein
MSTIAERDTEQFWVERRRAATRWSFVLPIVFGVFAFGAPTFSLGWALVVAAGAMAAVVVHGVFHARHGYDSAAATALYSTFQVDLMCFFATVFAWRMTHSRWWVLLVFSALVLSAAVIGWVRRRSVMQQLFAPQGAVGVVFVVVAALGGAGGGALGFALGRSVGGWVIGAIILAIACYAALARQALWLKVEEPGWQPRHAR